MVNCKEGREGGKERICVDQQMKVLGREGRSYNV